MAEFEQGREFPQFVYFDDASEEAKETLAKFKIDIEADPESCEDALNFYAAHPQAAAAIIELAQKDRDIVTTIRAIESVNDIFTNQYDMEAEFDEATMEELDNDQMHKHYLNGMKNGRNKDLQQHAKQSMRVNKFKLFIRKHYSPDNEGPDNASAA